ncbi:hypothetical protein AB4Z22_45735, partial [Paenibacillus sp. TAF58]
SLPLGIDLGDPAALAPIVQQTLDALVAHLREAAADAHTVDDVATALSTRLRDDTRPEPVRPLATARALESFDGDTIVQLRQGLRVRSDADEERVRIRLPRTTVNLPIAARAAVDALLTGDRVRVGELP